MNQRIFNRLPNVAYDEALMIDSYTENFSDEDFDRFMRYYGSKRKSEDIVLITCLVGLLGPAGIHRFILGQIGWGLLYLFTAGLCVIGTIVDAVNYKKLTLQYNIQVAQEALNLSR